MMRARSRIFQLWLLRFATTAELLLALSLNGMVNSCYGQQSPVVSSSASQAQPATARLVRSIPSSSARSSVDAAVSLSSSPSWPHRRELHPFQLFSTVPLELLDAQMEHLMGLPGEMQSLLGIPQPKEPIYIAVLENEAAFQSYLADNYPGVPARRAMYIRHRGPGLVLTWYHKNWIIDCRHEVTHALLHSADVPLPLWLDEGIAEYFEHTQQDRMNHPVHGQAVRSQLRFGQVAEIEDLEQLNASNEMSAQDYRDAWSCVAFMLNHSAESRNEFCGFMSDLYSRRASGLLSHRMRGPVPKWRESYTEFFRQRVLSAPPHRP